MFARPYQRTTTQLVTCFKESDEAQITATTSDGSIYEIDLAGGEPLELKIGTVRSSYRWGKVSLNDGPPAWELVAYDDTTRHFAFLSSDEETEPRHSVSVEEYHINRL